MKAKINQKVLLKMVKIAAKATAKKSTLAILGCVLIKAEQGGIAVTGTNLELAITVTELAQVDEPGQIAVPAKDFIDNVSSFPKGKDLELSVTGIQELCVVHEQAQVLMKGIDPVEFPVTSCEKQFVTSLDNGGFRKLASLWTGANDDGARPILTAVLAEFGPKVLDAVSCDGYHLRRQTIMAPAQEPRKMLIPAVTLKEMLSFLDKKTPVSIYTRTDGRVEFSHQNIDVSSTLVDGTYPNYWAIVPKNHPFEMTLYKEQFKTALEMVGKTAKKVANTTKFRVNSEDKAAIWADSAETGVNSLGLNGFWKSEKDTQFGANAEGTAFGEFYIAFDYNYMLDALAGINTGCVVLKFNKPDDPILMGPADGNDYFAVIMPMHTSK